MGLHVGDVALGGCVLPRAIVLQQKTQRPVQFEITNGVDRLITGSVRI